MNWRRTHVIFVFLSTLLQDIGVFSNPNVELPGYEFEILVVDEITEERSVCELRLQDQLRLCKEATTSEALRDYLIRFLDGERMGTVKTYELWSPRPLFRKQGLVSACKCPTRPAIYLKNRSTKKDVKILGDGWRKNESSSRPRRSIYVSGGCTSGNFPRSPSYGCGRFQPRSDPREKDVKILGEESSKTEGTSSRPLRSIYTSGGCTNNNFFRNPSYGCGRFQPQSDFRARPDVRARYETRTSPDAPARYGTRTSPDARARYETRTSPEARARSDARSRRLVRSRSQGQG